MRSGVVGGSLSVGGVFAVSGVLDHPCSSCEAEKRSKCEIICNDLRRWLDL